jgi:cell division protein FtsZ
LQEVNEAAELIHAEAYEDANIIWGMVIDPDLDDKVQVTVIATGFGDRVEDDKSVTMTQIMGGKETGSQLSSNGNRNVDVPAFARKAENSGGEVIKLKTLSMLSGSDDEDKYEIPTFLRKQVD